jgi:hypothetical protein
MAEGLQWYSYTCPYILHEDMLGDENYSLTSVLDGGEGSTSHLFSFTPSKEF